MWTGSREAKPRRRCATFLISSLDGAKLFVLTENQEPRGRRAARRRRGPGVTEVHSSSDGINAHANLGVRTGGSSRTSRGDTAGVGVGETNRTIRPERRHEAIAAVRLVNKDGDVIWSTTEESLGAKFHGASADVADKITTRLKEDFEKARKLK